MSPGATFERVFLALKEQLGSGRFAAGEHLDPAAIASELNSSITPVRDALHRLVGERLVEAPRNNGFQMPLVTEMGLRHLYAWNAKALMAAIKPAAKAGRPAFSAPAGDIDLVALTEQLFLAIAAASGNVELLDAVARLNDRLRLPRRIEVDLIANARAEIAAIEMAHGAADASALRRALGNYHRRRERAASEIVSRLHGRRQ